MLNRWYMLAARYVTAIEATAVATERIAAEQARAREMSDAMLTKTAESAALTAKANSRIADAHTLAAEHGPSRLELPELGPLVEGIRELAGMVAALKGKLPSLSEGEGDAK